jgi:hypothetical protein
MQRKPRNSHLPQVVFEPTILVLELQKTVLSAGRNIGKIYTMSDDRSFIWESYDKAKYLDFS